MSRQSRPLADEHALRSRAGDLVGAGEPVARPAEWSGYRLVPHGVEFWHGSPERLHRRLRYDRDDETSGWEHQRLQP